MRTNISFLAVLFLIISSLSYADFPLRQSANGDLSSVIAYNSANHEYLVVWSESIKMGTFYLAGPVMGQRLSESGNPIGSAFTVFNTGSLPSVAYNSKRNEYLVVCATLEGIYGQRIDNSGNLIETSTELDWEHVGNWPKVVYNYLTEDYLLVLAALQENPVGSGFYNIKIYGKRVSSLGQPMGLSWLIEDAPYGSNEYGLSRFAIAYAPIQSSETPLGRYLLAVQTNAGINLTMLNQWGYPIDAVYDPQSQQYFRYIPFSEGSVVGGEFNIDVAFGMKAGYNLPGPAFFVVWGDNNNTWQGQEWSGIYGSFVNPYKLDYLTTDPVQDNSFPISAIYDHYAFGTDEYAKSWKPKVAYNNAGQKFIVTWRETPTTNSQNDTKVNHIRADKEYTSGSYYTPNDVISAVTGNENPMQPAIASSSTNPSTLITWNDYRNFSTTDWDIYGNLYTIPSVPSITVTKPNGGENWFIDTEYEITWTSSDYSNPVRIEYSTDGGTTYTEIVNSTSNDGSYSWTVPFTLSNYCVVKVSDATDSDPFDISDQVFSITTTKKIVTNTNDSGQGSLRQAILDANSNAGYDTIIFKIPGTGVHTIQPLTQLPEITDPVLIDGFSQPGSSPNTNLINQGCNASLNIEVNGDNTVGANGFYIGSPGNSTLRGLIINGFDSSGIKIYMGTVNHIIGNYIGTDANGINAKSNSIGVIVENSLLNYIGGSNPSDRNIISGNTNGMLIINSSPAFYSAASRNRIEGNYFGIDATGLNQLGQSQNIIIQNSSYNAIGWSNEGSRNIISGSGGGSVSYDPPLAGIRIEGFHAKGNLIKGNYIGTDAAGYAPIPNKQAGIVLLSDSNIVGGNLSAYERNIISGNGSGLYISGNGNIISGNYIGTQIDGIGSLGNWEGIRIKGKNNSVGGTSLNDANVIAFNKNDGVLVISDVMSLGFEAEKNKILMNSIYANSRLGINLLAWNDDSLYITSNDVGDNDSGPNNLQNYPVLTDVDVDIATFITGSLNSTPNTSFRIDFYSSPTGDPSGYGEGQTHIGWTEVTTDANGVVDFYTAVGTIVPAGHVITATATDPNGNTSEFSNWIKNAAPTTFLVDNTNDSGTGSLRQAIIDANNNPGLDSIAFNIPGTGPFTIQPNTELPAITDPVIIDGYSQPGSQSNTNPISDGSNAIVMIELDGSAITSDYKHGLYILSSSTVRGLAINGFKMGITLESAGDTNKNCIIEGNYIGTNTSGSLKIGNEHGIHINSVNNNIIGGTNSASRNIISGNSTGIWVGSSQHNYILGNYIGTDATGKLNLGNFWGIDVFYSKYCFIGGTIDGSDNIISGNSTVGVSLDQVSHSYIQKNIIGLDAAGQNKLGNTIGLQLSHGCNSNYILDNIICENGAIGIGINIGSYNNFIGNNFIGTNEGWQYDLGNHGHGISIANTSNHNMIENNTIGFNDQCGIYIDTSLSNSLNRNSISKNGGKGIETINGGNKDIVPPLILSASPSIVTGTSSPGCIIEIFSDDEDEGRYFLGSTTADSSGNFALTITEPIPLSHVTATCTDAEGNTSEFSAPFIVTNVKFVKNEIPTEFGLHQNFPNPFNPITNISWQSPVSGRHTLKVYDILGKEVAALVNDEKEAGYHSIDFDASNLTSGVYFCRLTIKEFHSTIRMILIR